MSVAVSLELGTFSVNQTFLLFTYLCVCVCVSGYFFRVHESVCLLVDKENDTIV